jgi:hypothetical protein
MKAVGETCSREVIVKGTKVCGLSVVRSSPSCERVMKSGPKMQRTAIAKAAASTHRFILLSSSVG